jgi:4-hydroxy-tetrahydrodipicolinate synthase
MTDNSTPPDLRGVFAASVTPLTADDRPDLDALPPLLDFLAARGCHGVLLMGTTGEGPSFSVAERAAVFRTALEHRARALPGFRVLAGTGCASLAEAIELTRRAFDLGVDGVVTLPAFYYKAVSPGGLAAYYEQLVQAAVPADGRLLVYHIPQVSGVGIPAESIARLRERFPRQVWGMKDSQDDLPHTLAMTAQFPGFGVFVGSDSLMTDALAAGAAGSITALANVTTPLNRAVWDAHSAGATAPDAQARLARARQAVKGLSGPAAMKCALADLFGFPLWPVRRPLEMLSAEQREKVCRELAELLKGQ